MTEMIVTMAISAFLLVALFSLVSLTVRSFDRTSRMGDELETTSRVLSSLLRDLRLVSRVTFAGEDAGFVFLGTRDRLIYAYDLVHNGSSEMRVANLAGTALPGGYALKRSEATFVPSSTGIKDLAFGAPESVYAGRATVRFAYFDALADGREVLVDEWSEPAKLPAAIRVTLKGGEAGAPELSLRVPLMITAEPGCAAPETATCLSVEPEADADENVDTSDWWRYVR